ncbi:MAG: hypothetical protein RJA44_404 [Pseudomonadota bacterium]
MNAPASTSTRPERHGSAAGRPVGHDARQHKGWWRSQRWLLLRRLSQLGVTALFLLGPLAGLWLVRGNLSASLTLDVLPLTDPFVLAQLLATRHVPEWSALLGALLVIGFYALAGGRLYCAWVCPVNVVSDAASWLRRRLGISSGRAPRTRLGPWLLGAVLLGSALSGTLFWENVNPVSLTQRALIFGGSLAWGASAAVFLTELLIAPRGWCGHLCPAGAAYALLGQRSLLVVSASASSGCNDCADCYAVCPEPQVIPIALKGKDGAGPQILDSACTRCGRCIDVCAPAVYTYTHRFDHRRH